MINVLTSTKLVLDQAKNVSIDLVALQLLADEVNESDLQVSEINLVKHSWTFNELLQIIIIFNSVNFCFWARSGEPKWKTIIDGEELDGSIALFRCLEHQVKNDNDFLSGKNLANLTHGHLENILAGNTTIPLFEDRLKCLNELGTSLNDNFDGSTLTFYKEAKNDAIKLVELLIKYFPSFNDVSEYNSFKVGFYKRAQLTAKMINDLLINNNQKELSNLNKLTAFADYKIPQILRNLKIINYSDELATKVDALQLIDKDSKEEVEIRAVTVWAVELIKQEL